jgi:serine/threonine protein kinase
LQRWYANGDVSDLELPPTVVAPAKSKTDRLVPGGQFGRYKLIAALSADYTRKVFRAEDEAGRSILLKCLPPEWMSDRVRRSQFRQEVVLSCGLTHPCLAKVVEAGVQNGAEFLALEYIEGESLAQILLRDGPFDELQAIELLRPIAEVLHEIHAAGVIYRDLRPQNILLTRDRRPMLAEVRFSDELAPDDNITMSGWGDVTSKYIAPELLLGKASDAASEVYTLGATLYALVTGRDPYAEEQNAINLLIAKKASRYAAPQSLAPDLSDAVCQLIADAMNANLSARPKSAQAFAERLEECRQQSAPHIPAPPDSDNLLHTVWDQLDPGLQDAFSLAYNKKRRTGSNRISTRDLFEAMARLGTGPVREVFNELPAGALPDPTAADIPVDRSVLKEQPLLSDCVQESLGEFRKLGGVIKQKKKKVSAVDLFVDVANHGHGSSVVQLREHGVDPDALERIVNRLGLRVLRRETARDDSPRNDENYLGDDNVQFTVYRPKVVPPETWQPLLAFAHLADLPADAPAGTPDPVAEVQRQAEQVLGTRLSGFQSLLADSSQPIPRSSELTFVPTGDGLEFNPPQRSFRWNEPVHREEFRFQAAARLDGQIARGRLSVYLGRLLIAEVGIVTRVDRQASAHTESALSGENRAYRFRRIYACVARADRAVVSEFQHYAQLLRDTFLTSQFSGDSPPPDPQQLIRSADVFQLFWSRSAMDSAETEREWRYALSLKRTDFIRSLYWEDPFPADPARSLPPPELLALGFQKFPLRSEEISLAKSGSKFRKAAPKKSVSAKLQRVRSPRVDVSYRTEAYLELLNGSHIGKILRLNKDRVILGRKSDADLPLESNTVHRYHAQLVRDQNAWWVEDLQSRNGTFVNGARAQGRVRLNDGDRIHVGDVLIGFRAEAISQPADGGRDAASDDITLSPTGAAAASIPDDDFELSLGEAEDAGAMDSRDGADGFAFERPLEDADEDIEIPLPSGRLSQEIVQLPTAAQQAELLKGDSSADRCRPAPDGLPDRLPRQSAAPSDSGLFRSSVAYRSADESPPAKHQAVRWLAAAILGLIVALVVWLKLGGLILPLAIFGLAVALVMWWLRK